MPEERFGDWEYLAEGSAHVLFRRLACKESCVLRIPKRVRLLPEPTTDFLLNVAVPLLGRQYLFFPSFVELSEQFVASLRREVGSGGHPGRRSWDPSSISFPWTAELLPNCFSPFIKATAPDVLSVELKVKGGLRSSSPFLLGPARAKLHLSRFQLAHAYKHFLSNGSFEGYRSPGYRPIDLCSGDRDRVLEALRSLVDRPGNNLSVRINGRLVFGEFVGTIDELAQSWSSLLGDAASEDAMGSFLESVSHILVTESALPRLMRMQSLDTIDCEGCAVIFERLAFLCGSEVAALDMLRSSLGDPFPYDFSELFNKLSISTLSLSEQTTDGSGLVAKLMCTRVSASTSQEDLDNSYATAMGLVAELGVSECILFLRLWLVSLTAKDASVILSLMKEPTENGSSQQVHAMNGDGIGRHSAHRYRIAYSLKFIDINCKPVEKCISKIESEISMIHSLAPIFRSHN